MSYEALYSWGWGLYGQLGHGEEKDETTPKPLDKTSLQGHRIRDVACGFCFCVMANANGDVFSWGYGRNLQLGHADFQANLKLPRRIKFFKKEKNVVRVAAGREHAVAVLDTGQVYTWGSGDYGRLGHGNQANSRIPREVKSFSKPNSDTVRIVQVDCGLDHTLALEEDGNVFSWGLGLSGRLGHGDEKSLFEPKMVQALYDERIEVESVHCGWEHSAVLTRGKGYVYTWGSGRSYQLGRVQPPSIAPEENFCAKPTQVTRWVEKKGGNTHAYLQHPPKIIALSCGGKHNLALRDNGYVYSWGRGELGRLGHEDQRHKSFPYVVQALVNFKITQVSAGGYHSLALNDDGTVYAWGSNEQGRLIGGNQLYVCKPTRIQMTMPRSGHNKHLHAAKIYSGAYTSMIGGNDLHNLDNGTMFSSVQKMFQQNCTIL